MAYDQLVAAASTVTAHHRRRWDDYQPGEQLRRHSDPPRDLGAAVGI